MCELWSGVWLWSGVGDKRRTAMLKSCCCWQKLLCVVVVSIFVGVGKLTIAAGVVICVGVGCLLRICVGVDLLRVDVGVV